MRDIGELMERIGGSVMAGRSFGPAFEHEGCVVIPAAFVIAGGGGGGEFPQADHHSGNGAGKNAEGSGGGFGGISWPIGAYVIKDGNVTFKPAIDATRVVLAALGIVRVMIGARRFRRG